MQKLIVVAAVLACAYAAPVENIKETFQITDLSRPSPINPDIPSDPKPEDKVTLIAEPKEVPLLESKATPKLLGPYILPEESLLRSKRADKDSSESDDSSSSEEDSDEKKKKSSPPLKARPLAGPSADLLQKIAAKTSTTPKPSSTESSSSDGTTLDASTTSNAPVLSKKPYSPEIHQHNAHLIKPTENTNTDDSSAASTSTTTTSAPSVVASNDDHINEKRDIPVPLTRKHQHDDDDETKKQNENADTTKTSPKEEVKQEDKKDEDQKAESTPHPATIQHPIPVAELFAKKPSE